MMDKKDCVCLYENSEQLIRSAIDNIVVEILRKREVRENAQTILLTGCSALAGTTSVSINLAIAVANTKRRTLLIDCDMRKTVKYKKLNEQVTLGLSDYLSQEKDEIQREMITYPTNIENLTYIPCGRNVDNATRALGSTEMEELLRCVKKEYDIVIFDLPAVTIVPDAQILMQSVDGIILLAALGETRKKQIREAKRKIAQCKNKYYGMIINKVQKDMYRMNVDDYDYYFMDKSGEQKLSGNPARKKYTKLKREGENK